MYYLYVKTHNQTGLKYLGQTSKNPYDYKGSGKYWVRYINKHGNDVTTEILGLFKTKNELKEAGLYYSNLFNVVESNDWANLDIENGIGGGSKKMLYDAGIKGYSNGLAKISFEDRSKMNSENSKKGWNKLKSSDWVSPLKGRISPKKGIPNPKTSENNKIMWEKRKVEDWVSPKKGKKESPENIAKMRLVRWGK